MKCTFTRRGIARISADALFLCCKKLVLKSTFQSPIYCPKCRNSLPSHPLYIRYIEKIKSKILMRCTDFMAQVNYCKRGQGPCEFNLPVKHEYSYNEPFRETVYPKTLVNFGVLPLWKHVVPRRTKIASRIAQTKKHASYPCIH